MFCLKTAVKLFLCGAVIVSLIVSSADAKTILASSYNYDSVLMYEPGTGNFQGVFASKDDFTSPDSKGGVALNEPTGIAFGPDGNVYVGYRDSVGDHTRGGILKFSSTGDYLGEFYMGKGNIEDVKFGPDGNLYFTQYGRPVYRVLGPNDPNAGTLDASFSTPYGVEACTGLAFVENGDGSYDYFVSMRDTAVVERRHVSDSFTLVNTYTRPTTVGGVTDEKNYGLEIGPDGRLYLGTEKNIFVADLEDSVMTVFADSASATGGDLATASGMMFDDDDNLLVENYKRGAIEKFSGVDGSYLGQFVAPWSSSPALWLSSYGLELLDLIPGDADLSGTVDELDAAILASNWLTASGATWVMGDFNGDEIVNDIDATMMAANWTVSQQAAVPEPSTLALLACSLSCLLVWRRR